MTFVFGLGRFSSFPWSTSHRTSGVTSAILAVKHDMKKNAKTVKSLLKQQLRVVKHMVESLYLQLFVTLLTATMFQLFYKELEQSPLVDSISVLTTLFCSQNTPRKLWKYNQGSHTYIYITPLG